MESEVTESQFLLPVDSNKKRKNSSVLAPGVSGIGRGSHRGSFVKSGLMINDRLSGSASTVNNQAPNQSSISFLKSGQGQDFFVL